MVIGKDFRLTGKSQWKGTGGRIIMEREQVMDQDLMVKRKGCRGWPPSELEKVTEESRMGQM